MPDNLSEYLKEKRALVEERLHALLMPRAGLPASLLEAMRYSVLAPGKRLRPLLVILAAEACGGKDQEALPAACALEMVHVYSLIHDDLPAMDDDDLRRGQPTCHKKFNEASAILAGDALLTYAFQVLTEHYPADVAAACCRELAVAAGGAGMVGGQVDDLAWEEKNDAGTLEDLEQLHSRKTGALFRACLRLGALVALGENAAETNRDIWNGLDAYGRCFGLAFQITDDLLDSEGTAETTGKAVQKDAARGKLTYPFFLGLAESRRRARALMEEACRHVTPLGAAGSRLAGLVPFILERTR